MAQFEKTSYSGVYKKGDKYFINYWSLEGKCKRVWARGATTAKEAKRQLDEIKHEIADQRDGKIAMPIDKSVECKTLDELAKRFFDLRDTKGNEADRGRYEKWVSPQLGSNKHPISQLDLEGYRKWLRKQEIKRGEASMLVSPKTVNIIVGLLGNIIKWGVGAKLVAYPNGIPSLKRLPIDNDRERVLNKDEIDKLLSELDTRKALSHKRETVRRNRLVVLLGLYTGARPISYLDLRVKDVVLDKREKLDDGSNNPNYGKPARIKFSARKGAKAYEVPVAEKLKLELEVAMLDKELS
jgi:integrase